MFNKFTERARKVILLAKEEAKKFNHDYIGTEHLLLGLIREGEGVAAAVLVNLGLDLEKIRFEVEKLVQPGPSTAISGDIPFTPKAKRVIELAMDEARSLAHNYIGTEHLLLGLLKEGEGMASQVLSNLGLQSEKAREEIMQLLGLPTSEETELPKKSVKTKTPALDSFGRDLTKLALDGKLDPVVGRHNEIERVIQILSRRTKNNPVLLGEAGVGKTAIVEGLAQQVVSGDIPEVLKGKRIVVIDLALMIAGTKYRGQFEERIKAVIDELKKAENIIIFVDEIHTLVGAGGAEGAIDAANILKPALSRGEIQCIGATTLDEYRKNIEKDSALERRFQTIMVEQPGVDETVRILKGLRDKYEAHHRIKFSDAALQAAAELSDRYISGRYQPDKSIDLIDEAGSRIRLKMMTAPTDVKEIEVKINEAKKEKEDAVSNQNFETASVWRDKERQLREELQKVKKEWQESKKETEGTVSEEDIAKIVSSITGIPIVRLESKESKKYLNMENEIKSQIVGQDEAVATISNAIRRSRSGIKDPKRPIGSFVFLGPTGVGKSLLAKVLAEFMFGDKEAIIQIDMSEYMEKFNISRLVGAPPGYVGYDEGGQLTERVRRRPYSIVLLDEIEKAHPDVFNILLQVLEEGRLTDSFGRKVDFRNTVIIMTSNIGAASLRKQGAMGFVAKDGDIDHDKQKQILMEEVKKAFKPEFLNRVDDIAIFRSLAKEHLKIIIDIELKEVEKRLLSQNIILELNADAKTFLIERGYSSIYGARPLKRTIQRFIEDKLAHDIIDGKYKDGTTIKVSVADNELVFTGSTKKK